MHAYLWIGLGGALGSMARYWIFDSVARRWGDAFPWGTILANVSGCFLIGFLYAWTEVEGRMVLGPTGRQFFMFGLLGGYTTFSSFSLQTLIFLQRREWLPALTNVFGSVMLCLLAVWIGFAISQAINERA